MLARLRVPALSVSLALSAFVGCGGGSSSSSSPTPPPSQVSIAITPEQTLQTVLKPQTFSAKVTGASNRAVTWSVVSGGGSIDATTGLYIAGPMPGPAIVKATLTANPAVSATQAVTLVAAPTIGGFTTSSAVIPYGGSASITPTFTTDGTAVITPSVTGGAITSGSSYAISPSAITSYTLTVTNSAGTSVAAAVTVNVQTAQVSIAPAAVTLTTGYAQKFSAIVGGAVNTGVTWSATGGAITTSGSYTAPTTPGDYAVVATSAADPSKSVLAAVHVVAMPAISAFTASSSTISQGHGTVLSYTFSGGAGAIDQGVGSVVSTGTANIAPGATEKYTLTVTNAAGVSVSSAATITVVPPPDATITLGSTVPANGILPANTFGFTASAPVQARVAYTWTLSGAGATVTSGGTTNKVTFATQGGENTATLTCSVLNTAGDTATASVPLQVQRRWRPPMSGPSAGYPTPTNTYFDMAVDDTTFAWLAWRQLNPPSGADTGIYVSHQTSYSAWTTPVRLDTGSVPIGAFGYPVMATDNHGHAIVVWFEEPGSNYQLWGSYYNGSAWSAATRIDTGGTTGTAEYPSVGMDAAGNAIVIWDQMNSAVPAQLVASRYSAGTFSAPVEIDADATNDAVGIGLHGLAVDPGGGAVAVWAQVNTGTSLTEYRYRIFNGSTWQSPVSSGGAPMSIPATIPMATTNGHGSGLIANPGYDKFHLTLTLNTYTLSLDGTGWPPTPNPVDTYDESGSASVFPSLVGLSLNPSGVAVVAGTNSDYSMFVSRLDPNTEHWSQAFDPGLTTSIGLMNTMEGAALSSGGSAPVVWLDDNTGALLGSGYDSILGAWTQPLAFQNGNLVPNGMKVRVSPNGIVTMLGVVYIDASGGHFYTFQYN